MNRDWWFVFFLKLVLVFGLLYDDFFREDVDWPTLVAKSLLGLILAGINTDSEG